MMNKLFFVLFLTFFSLSSFGQPTGDIPDYDFCGIEIVDGEEISKEKDQALLECFDKNEANRYESWNDNLNSKLSHRVQDATDALLSAIKIDNIRFGYPGDPRRPKKRPEELQRIAQQVIEALPKEVKKLAEDKLLALVFIEDLGTSAYAPYTFKKDNKPYGGIVILDVSFLGKTANERQTFREKTLFDNSGPYDLKVTITDEDSDDVYHAMQEVIIHELGHIITYGAKYVPLPGRPIDVSSINEYNFFNFHWKVEEGKAKLQDHLQRLVPFQNELKFYRSKPPMTNNDIVPAYQALNKTCFPSLYSIRAQEEDFVEGFTHYVRHFMLKQSHPYTVQVTKDGTEVLSSGSIWYRGQQCNYVKEYFENLLFN